MEADNARFIAHARTAAPELAAFVQRVAATWAEVSETIDHHDECGVAYAIRKYNRGIRIKPPGDDDCTCGLVRLRAAITKDAP